MKEQTGGFVLVRKAVAKGASLLENFSRWESLLDDEPKQLLRFLATLTTTLQPGANCLCAGSRQLATE